MVGESSLRRLVPMVVSVVVLLLVPCAGAQGAGDAAPAKLGAAGKRMYGAVEHGAKVPRIGPISLRRARTGGLEARFRVRYPGVLRRGSARAVLRLVVARRIAGNEQPRGMLREITDTRKLGRGAETLGYRLRLGSRASKVLRAASPDLRAKLLRVEAGVEVDGDRDGRADHRIRAASTLGHSSRPLKAAAVSDVADNTITLQFINATDGPINNVALPVMCMWDGGNEGSWVSGFNATQSAIIPSGGSIVQGVAADGSALSDPDFMSPIAPDQLETPGTRRST